MSEFLHHLLGAAWNFLLLAGALTLLARLWLSYRLDHLEHPADFDGPDVLGALVLPTLLPLAWLASAIAHLMEPGRVIDHCCAMLAGFRPSIAEAAFGAGMIIVLGIQLVSLAREWRQGHRSHPGASGRERRRVARIREDNPHLSIHVRVVNCRRRSCMTRGLLRPWIEISSELCRQLDDDALEAALLHEAAHGAMLDPLRSVLVLVSQILNPFAGLLTRHAEAWRFATEVGRDLDAVRHGARPLAMADALVTAAQCQSDAGFARCHLHGPRNALEARVKLLLSGGSRRGRSARGLSWLLGVAFAGLVLPHVLGARLFSLHCVLERLLS